MEDGRDVALELRRMVHGDLRGMFDGPTTPGIDLTAPLVVLDLSAVYNSPALGVLMACAAAWLQGALRAAHRQRVVVVVDEAWAILANLGVARWLQASWKLSRAFGVANMAVLHRLSDLGSVGAGGSEQVGLARGLLADSETRVVYAQPPGEVGRSAEAAGADRHRGRPRPPAAPGGRPVEGGPAVVPGRAPAVAGGARPGGHGLGHVRCGRAAAGVTAQDAVATVVGLAAYAATGLVGRGSSGWRPPAGRGGSGTARGWGMTARPSRRRRRPHHRHVRRSTALVGRRAPGGRGARWARRGDLAPLDVGRGGPPAGRLVIGRSGGRLLAAERVQSVVVFGPTQSRKTSGFAVPAILEWQGPVVATSSRPTWCATPSATGGPG